MLLLIIDELMYLCLDCCWIMLLILIHALGIAICVVLIQVVVFDVFLVKWVKKEKCDFWCFEWNVDVVVMNQHEYIFYFEL